MNNIHANDSSQGIELFGTPDSQTSTFEDDEGSRSFFVRALYDFSSNDASSLSFGRGALIEVLTQLESGWWDGLLGNDVRGWFPSNYVEVISDEEAEMELAARDGGEVQSSVSGLDEDPQKREPSHYGGLGLGQDFDVLRQLMQGDSVLESNDAFEQLAEAGMRESSHDQSVSSGSTVAASRSKHDSRTTPAESTQTDLTSLPTQSINGSPNDATRSKPLPASNHSRLGPSEKERMRAQSLFVEPGRDGDHVRNGLDNGRPRAATDSSSPHTGERRRKKKNESDFWVPRVTDRGEIIYFNTRTGAKSHDLPDGLGIGVEGESSVPSSDEDEEASSSSDRSVVRSLKSPKRRPLYGRHTSTIYADAEGSRSRAASDSRPSTAAGRRNNGIENMPDPRDVPWPWIPRASDDEKTFYFYNRQTHEISYDTPTITPGNDSTEELVDVSRGGGARKSRATTMDSNEGTWSREDYFYDAGGPLSRHADERDAIDLQREMMMTMRGGVGTTPLHSLIDSASHAISQLASIASESVAADGLSELDRRYMMPKTSTLVDSSRLGAAIGMVVNSIRDLLYSAGSLAVTDTDLLIVSELAWMIQEEDSLDARAAFHASITALHILSTPNVEPHIAVARQQAKQLPPSSLTSLGKKINATLSKLVLSARSVIEQSCLNTSTRPELTTAQLEKIASYRQRIKDDSLELARALGAFGVEADRSRVALGGGIGIPWVRQVEGVLKSGKGAAGIGVDILGGGAAAGWRGNGFVLPSATEAAALRAEAMGSYQNPFELTKDARNALSSGKVSLRRKPTNVMTRVVIEKRLAIAFAQLESLLSEVRERVEDGSINRNNPRKDAISKSTQVTKGAKSIQNIGAKALTTQVKEVLSQVGSVLIIVEDMDMATSMDVDGPSSETITSLNQDEVQHMMRNVKRARELLHHFASTKQEMYDVSNYLFLEVQNVGQQVARRPSLKNEEAAEAIVTLLNKLEKTASNLQQIVSKIIDVAEEQQAKESLGQIGARSKVYGIDDVKLSEKTPRIGLGNTSTVPASRLNASDVVGAAQSVETMTAVSTPIDDSPIGQESQKGGERDDVMYLGPGLAVPNGPPMSARTLSGSLKASLHEGLRARSTSVTTGASVNSHDSGTKSSIRKGGDDDDGDSTKKDQKVNNKLKRFFGDDAPTVSTLRDSSFSGETIEPPPSATPSTTTITKTMEETPWFLEVDYSPEDIVMNASGQVKGATLSALMERLTMHNAFDANFNTTFLMTYRSFTSTEELLDLLSARFRTKEPPGLTKEEHQLWVDQKQMLIRFRIFNVLKTWLEAHFYEGTDEVHLKRIEHFVLDGMGQSPILGTPGKHLIRLIERRSGIGEKMVRKLQMPSSTPAPILPKNFRKIKFLDIDPLEMARQLTLMDSRLYNRIRPIECLNKAWSRENGLQVAKGIRDVISANNRVSGWVSEAILVQEDLKKRAAWVKQFVAIANCCHSLNNFSSMMAIYSGLNNASLNRLRRTWDAVNQRHLQMFENMKNLLAPTKNFSKYRETLRQLNPPCVPFLGVYLTDLTFIEDGNSDRLKTDERLINFSKRQMTADKIQEIMIYQNDPFNLTPVPSIQKFIEENLIDSRRDEELFEQSLRLEPREREDEKIARLLQESGFL